MRNKTTLIIICIIFIGAFLFIPFLGSIHLFDWDEVNFAEASREMIVTGDFLTVRIDYEPFHEKQPLFFWLQAISMKIFGINEFSARFPNAIIGIISLIAIFLIGRKLYDNKFGVLWVISYIGSFLPNFYFRTGLIDPTFNLFIFIGSYFVFKYINLTNNKDLVSYKYIIIAGLFVGLAVMTKGPVGYLFPTITWLIYWIINRKKIISQIKGLVLFSFISFLPLILWYSIILYINGWDLLIKNLNYQIRLLLTNDAGFSGPFYYHFLVVLFGCYPASVLAIPSFRKISSDNTLQQNYRLWLIILLGTVLIIFSIVQTKIVHYSSLAYLPITYLSAHFVYYLSQELNKFKTWQKILFVVIGLFWSLLMISIPIIGLNASSIAKQSTDLFTQAVLNATVEWYFYEIIFGVIYLISIFVSFILFYKKKIQHGFFTITLSTTLILFFYILLILPKIEVYIQNAPIEFFKSLKGKSCYIELLDVPNLKYSHYFYTQKPPELSINVNCKIPKTEYTHWLLKGNIDLPAYFVTKVTEIEKYRNNYPDIETLYTKNGYAFLVRYAK